MPGGDHFGVIQRVFIQPVDITRLHRGIDFVFTDQGTAVAETIQGIGCELWVDIKTGIVLMQTSTIDAATNIDAGGMLIPSTIKTITTINITRSVN